MSADNNHLGVKMYQSDHSHIIAVKCSVLHRDKNGKWTRKPQPLQNTCCLHMYVNLLKSDSKIVSNPLFYPIF